MGFFPVKSDTGAKLPWEYLAAAAGTYKAGQLLNITGGELTAITAASSETPPYLCMADVTVTEAGTPIPVTRVSKDYIYETTLAADNASAVPGAKLGVDAEGMAADGTGTFELVSVDGTSKDDVVRGRWA